MILSFVCKNLDFFSGRMIFSIGWLTVIESEALIGVCLAHRFDELFGIGCIDGLFF